MGVADLGGAGGYHSVSSPDFASSSVPPLRPVLPAPAFDADLFTITVLAQAPAGFAVETELSRARRPPVTVDRPADAVVVEAQRQIRATPDALNWRVGRLTPSRRDAPWWSALPLLHDSRWSRSAAAQHQRDRLVERGVLRPQQVTVAGDHLLLLPGFEPKVCILRVVVDEGVVRIAIAPGNFRGYKAASAMGRIAGTACILTTSDGWIFVPFRPDPARHYFYGGVPGAGVAGYLAGDLITRRDDVRGPRGTLAPIGDRELIANISREATEELGLSLEDLGLVAIVGFGTDLLVLHDEWLLVARSSLTRTVMEGRIAAHLAGNRRGDVPTGGVFIPYTPDAIARLVTESDCPIPPSHAAAYVAAGYHLVLTHQGVELAEAWIRDVEPRVAANYWRINDIVHRHWRRSPDARRPTDGRRMPPSYLGYEPAFSPRHQGLPAVGEDLIRRFQEAVPLQMG